MLKFDTNLKHLVYTSFLVFAGLSTLVAIIPAFQMQKIEALPTMKPMSEQETKGLQVFVSENCMACHTQQVRNIEMDNVWGQRPSLPSDYYYNKKRMDIWRMSPSILGSERTGPDLTNVGKRQAGKEWHLLHLYNPRSVVKESVMPSYPWLFEEKSEKQIKDGDVVVAVPESFLKNPSKKIVASQKALDLVAYLISLKQADIGTAPSLEFIPAKVKEAGPISGGGDALGLPDGDKLYMNTCAACHQQDGNGLAGAFPPLKGSAIVLDANPEKHIRIILQGYDANPEYGLMTPFAEVLEDDEIAAIVNHERTSWGNNAPTVTAEDVKKIRAMVGAPNP